MSCGQLQGDPTGTSGPHSLPAAAEQSGSLPGLHTGRSTAGLLCAGHWLLPTPSTVELGQTGSAHAQGHTCHELITPSVAASTGGRGWRDEMHSEDEEPVAADALPGPQGEDALAISVKAVSGRGSF